MINRIIIILTTMLFMAGCSKDSTGSNGYAGTETDVEIRLDLPVSYGVTRAGDRESVIETLDLLVFEGDEFRYRRHAYLQSGMKYRSTLKIGNNQTIYFLANCRADIESCTLLVDGNSWDTQIKPALVDTNPGALVNKQEGLPMWGMKKSNIMDVTLNDLGKVSMLRSVAAVEVTVIENDNIFEMTKCYIYFAPDKGFLASSESDINDFLSQQLTPKSPAGMTTSVKIMSDAVNNNILEKALYLYDNDAAAASGSKRYSRLVVGGKYKQDTQETFYALDFLDTQNNIVKVTRNHKYTFVITKVNGEGATDPDEAAEMASVNMEADVIDWDRHEDSDIFIDGSRYVTINSRYCMVGPSVLAVSQLALASNIPAGDIEINFRDNANGPQVKDSDGSITNDLYKVELVEDINGCPTAVKFTALTSYSSSDPDAQVEYVEFKARNIKFTITVARTDSLPNDWDNGGSEDHEIG